MVAHAVVGMAINLCRDALTRALAVAACAALLVLATVWMAPVVIVASGVIALLLVQHQSPDRSAAASPGPMIAAHADGSRTRRGTTIRERVSVAVLVLFAFLLFGLPFLASQGGGLAIADSFYRAGALVFGGGHVVLPLLQAETQEWVTPDAFLAGYGAAQALPGPLFAFAAYVGAAGGPMPGWSGGLIALAFVFLPGLLLVAAALSWWDALKQRPRARGFVMGANAAVVGVLAAALWDPVITSGVRGPWDAVIAAAGFALLQWAKAPVWLAVALVAAAGAALSA